MIKNILCIGGSGQLGSKIINILGKNNIVNVDFAKHQSAKQNLLLNKDLDTITNNKNVITEMQKINQKFDAMIVTAGGWIGGNIKDVDYLDKLKVMNEACLYPSLLAAHLAYKHLNPNGLVVFTGAAAVFKEPQPQMIAYSLAKTGVHSLAMNLAENAHEFQGRVITILPTVIDTEQNRQGMPSSDFTKWTKPDQIGELLKGWTEGLNVPNNGSFVVLETQNGCIKTQFV